jgi:hypothetical protein
MSAVIYWHKRAVAEQAQQIERLTNENWRLQAGEAVMLKPHLGLISRLTAEIERLREALQTADETLIEINLSNYGMDDVDRLNNSSIEASQIIRAALQPKEGE